jgi:hypothetical protein
MDTDVGEEEGVWKKGSLLSYNFVPLPSPTEKRSAASRTNEQDICAGDVSANGIHREGGEGWGGAIACSHHGASLLNCHFYVVFAGPAARRVPLTRVAVIIIIIRGKL